MVKFVISSPAMKPRKVLLELLCRFYQSPSSYTREHDDGPPPRLAAGPLATGVGRQLIQWCLDLRRPEVLCVPADKAKEYDDNIDANVTSDRDGEEVDRLVALFEVTRSFCDHHF